MGTLQKLGMRIDQIATDIGSGAFDAIKEMTYDVATQLPPYLMMEDKHGESSFFDETLTVIASFPCFVLPGTLWNENISPFVKEHLDIDLYVPALSDNYTTRAMRSVYGMAKGVVETFSPRTRTWKELGHDATVGLSMLVMPDIIKGGLRTLGLKSVEQPILGTVPEYTAPRISVIGRLTARVNDLLKMRREAWRVVRERLNAERMERGQEPLPSGANGFIEAPISRSAKSFPEWFEEIGIKCRHTRVGKGRYIFHSDISIAGVKYSANRIIKFYPDGTVRGVIADNATVGDLTFKAGTELVRDGTGQPTSGVFANNQFGDVVAYRPDGVFSHGGRLWRAITKDYKRSEEIPYVRDGIFYISDDSPLSRALMHIDGLEIVGHYPRQRYLKVIRRYESTVFQEGLSKLNETLKAYDEALATQRRGVELNSAQRSLLTDSDHIKLAQTRSEYLRSGTDHHQLATALTSDSPILAHLQAHVGDVDLGSNLRFGPKEVFRTPNDAVRFAEETLGQAYQDIGKPSPGEPQFTYVNGTAASYQVMSTGEAIDGVNVGSSGPGGRIVIKVHFTKEIGDNGITIVEDSSNVTQVIRTSGGRQETVSIVNGAKTPTGDMIIIGGPYGTTGTFGLYTFFTGTYAPPMSDVAFWRHHAFVTGDINSFVRKATGVEIRPESNLARMVSDGKVEIPK